MKQFSSLAIVILFSTPLFATIRTVSNNPATLAQYNTIQAAIDASSSGDSIYIHGSPNDYATFTITEKRLTIMGPGWSPNKNLPFTARVPNFTITGTGCDNTEIQGLIIFSTVTINSNSPDNLRFIRNHFNNNQIQMLQGSTTYTGYLFEGNLFDGCLVNASTSSNFVNFLFQNNYFYENASTNGNIYGFTNSTNVLFDHNLWFGPSVNAVTVFGNNCRFLIITNNVFVRRNPATNNTFSTFNNNITFNCGTNNPWAVNSNTNAGGNVENLDPQMVDQNGVNSGTDNPLLNFTIAAGPANNTGSDGKDMGLLFDASGSLNWTNSRMSRIPFIFSMNITNPTISPGGSLNVQVEARKSN
jgi:hypothetical protein